MDKIPSGLHLLIVTSALRHEGKRIPADTPVLLAPEVARNALASEAARHATDDEIAAYEASLPSPAIDRVPLSIPPLDVGLSALALGDVPPAVDALAAGEAPAAVDTQATATAATAKTAKKR